jgi:hypothetical protein
MHFHGAWLDTSATASGGSFAMVTAQHHLLAASEIKNKRL